MYIHRPKHFIYLSLISLLTRKIIVNAIPHVGSSAICLIPVFFYPWSCRLLGRFGLFPSTRPGLLYAEVAMSVCHIDYFCREMVSTSSLVHQLGPVGGGWFWGMGVGAYVHSTHSFPSPTFLQPP